jgi:hypothetical protein
VRLFCDSQPCTTTGPHRYVRLWPGHDLGHEPPTPVLDFHPCFPVVWVPQHIMLVLNKGKVHSCRGQAARGNIAQLSGSRQHTFETATPRHGIDACLANRPGVQCQQVPCVGSRVVMRWLGWHARTWEHGCLGGDGVPPVTGMYAEMLPAVGQHRHHQQ